MMIIYETRNLVNGKVYRGQHICGRRCQTGCKYLGSGEALKRAIEKYGRHNFRRRILAYATYPSVLNDLEKIYVTDDFVARQETYNQMTGGGSNGIPGAETRKKMSAAWIARYAVPGQREKTSAALMGHEISTETKEKISKALTGKVIPPKVRKKISAAMTGKKHTSEVRKKISAAMTGKKHNAERCAASSAAQKDKPKSDEHKAAMRDAWTDERREKTSAVTSAAMTQARRALQSANQKKVWAKKRQAEQTNQAAVELKK